MCELPSYAAGAPSCAAMTTVVFPVTSTISFCADKKLFEPDVFKVHVHSNDPGVYLNW